MKFMDKNIYEKIEYFNSDFVEQREFLKYQGIKDVQRRHLMYITTSIIT